MRIFRISNILILCLASGLGGALFWTSQKVQERQDVLADVMDKVAHEEETLSVLGTEWDYLNRPQRIERLARDYLSVGKTKETRILTHAAAVPEPSFPILPPSKPAIIPAMIRTGAPAAATTAAPPAPVIEQNDSAKFEALLSDLSGGGQ